MCHINGIFPAKSVHLAEQKSPIGLRSSGGDNVHSSIFCSRIWGNNRRTLNSEQSQRRYGQLPILFPARLSDRVKSLSSGLILMVRRYQP